MKLNPPITVPTPRDNGWSQFESWAGMNWFGDGPLLPPKTSAATKESDVNIGRKRSI